MTKQSVKKEKLGKKKLSNYKEDEKLGSDIIKPTGMWNTSKCEKKALKDLLWNLFRMQVKIVDDVPKYLLDFRVRVADLARSKNFCNIKNGKCTCVDSGKGFLCCNECAYNVGYLRRITRDDVFEIFKYWHPVKGFHRKTKGCILPLKFRSLTCSYWFCNYVLNNKMTQDEKEQLYLSWEFRFII